MSIDPPIGTLLFVLVSLPVVVDHAEAAPDSEVEMEQVIVTASRITRPDFSFSNPVISILGDEIQQSGKTDLVDLLKQTPALAASLGHDATTICCTDGVQGLSALDLRGLGFNRTLVLVNGRRSVGSPFPGGSAVDVDTLPAGLIDRVEVMTGGASALYGADAVSGVVNFVMKNRFEGLDLSMQTGASSRGDRNSRLATVTFGQGLASGKGHVSLALEYLKSDGLMARERGYASGIGYAVFVQNPDDPLDDPSIPDLVPLTDIRFNNYSHAGAVDTDLDFVNDFNGNDQPWDFGQIPSIAPDLQQGGDGSLHADYKESLLPGEERYTLTSLFDLELSRRHSLFAEFSYNNDQSVVVAEGLFDGFLFIDPANPFVPPNIGAAAAGGPILVTRDHFDMGRRVAEVERRTIRFVLGTEGTLGESLDYEASYTYNKADVDNLVFNNRFNDRMAAALDVVVDPVSGQPVCRSELDPDFIPLNLIFQEWDQQYEPLPGTWAGSFTPGSGQCVPLNIFGENAASPAAVAWINTHGLSVAGMELHSLQAFVRGDSSNWWTMPGGPVSFVVGLEWRSEDIFSEPPEENRLGLTWFNKYDGERGHQKVKELFAEVEVPLLMGSRLAEVLVFDAAVRFSDYSTIGATVTWKAGLVWEPFADLTLRTTYAKAVRAPALPDLYSPAGENFGFISDPCDINNVGNGGAVRATNCNSLLNGLGVDPTTFLDGNGGGVFGLTGGNPDLVEETARTWTFGLIYTPGFVEGLTANLDFFDIALTDAINYADAQSLANLCVDLPGFGSAFCSLVSRDPVTGQVDGFTSRPENITALNTVGVDFGIEYLLDLSPSRVSGGLGALTLRLSGSHLHELEAQNIPAAPFVSSRGMMARPRWQANLDARWDLAKFTVNWRVHYFSPTFRFDESTRANNPDIVAPEYFKYDRKLTQDLFAEYRFNEQIRLFGGVNNVTNQKPDIGELSYPVSPVGRFLFLGLNYQL